MLEKLSLAIKKATDKIANSIFLDKTLVENIIKELQRALIEADVNIHLIKELSDKLRKKAFDERIKGVEKKEHLIKTLHDYLLEILGKEKQELVIKKGDKILLLGLYGSGKTTTSAKLANYYNKRGFNSCILGLDIHRPAASEQLEQLGNQNKIKVFINKTEKNPEKIYKEFKKEIEKHDLTIIDTAGRHTLDKELITEIKTINKILSPQHIILVIPADIGQVAKKLAAEFKETLNITGTIITRMDSSAKAGGSLTACNETKSPVYFITTGEKINDIETFNPSSFISRILGMGDLETLIEKINLAVDKKSQENSFKKLQEGEFTLDDFQQQLESMNSLGPLDKLTSLIPGLGKAKIPENLMTTQQDKMKKWKFAIQSMTPEEKSNPEILSKQTSRLQRISRGSGISTTDIRSLLKQYSLLKDFMKTGENIDMSNPSMLSQKQLQKLAKKFGKKIRI